MTESYLSSWYIRLLLTCDLVAHEKFSMVEASMPSNSGPRPPLTREGLLCRRRKRTTVAQIAAYMYVDVGMYVCRESNMQDMYVSIKMTGLLLTTRVLPSKQKG